MRSIFSLFGRSPFAPLQSHMEKVSECVYMLKELFNHLHQRDYQALEKVSQQICDLEHQADLAKNDIRNHLPKSLFLPIDRGNLLNILFLQDKIADKAEDIAVLTTFKELTVPPSLEGLFTEFLHKNLETFDGAKQIIYEMHELLESSFGGIEAEKVRGMVDDVSYKEHEADLIQQKLLKGLFQLDTTMNYGTFYLWQKIFETIGSIANLSENLAHGVRTTLDLK